MLPAPFHGTVALVSSSVLDAEGVPVDHRCNYVAKVTGEMGFSVVEPPEPSASGVLRRFSSAPSNLIFLFTLSFWVFLCVHGRFQSRLLCPGFWLHYIPFLLLDCLWSAFFGSSISFDGSSLFGSELKDNLHSFFYDKTHSSSLESSSAAPPSTVLLSSAL